MVYVTGDTHGSIDFEKLRQFSKDNQGSLTRGDYLIIAGDFGAVWSPDTLDEDLNAYRELPFTVLFVDGNHENFNMLGAYPVEEWKGGKIHKIADNIFHLMRGQIFEIDGKRILTLGGATSTDRMLRKRDVSWWAQEAITQNDVDEAIKNLKKYDGVVDYVITHSCSSNTLLYHAGIFARYGIGQVRFDENVFLNTVEDNLKDFKHWYFGHFHFDGHIDFKHTAIYDEIVALD